MMSKETGEDCLRGKERTMLLQPLGSRQNERSRSLALPLSQSCKTGDAVMADVMRSRDECEKSHVNCAKTPAESGRRVHEGRQPVLSASRDERVWLLASSVE